MTTSGSGTGAGISLTQTAGSSTITGAIVVTIAGSGYAVGDTITVPSATVGGAADLVIGPLTADDICAPSKWRLCKHTHQHDKLFPKSPM